MIRRPSALLLLATLLPATAAAQDADTFDISGSNLDGQGTLQRHDPHLDDRPTWYAGLGLVYANDPLVLIDGAGDETIVVGGQTSARIQAGYNFSGKVRLDLDIPTYPSVNVNGQGQFAMGDIRVGALVPLVSYGDEGVGVAVTPYVTLPTGDAAAYDAEQETSELDDGSEPESQVECEVTLLNGDRVKVEKSRFEI